ncbi:molybdenum cofactor biosynthesis protein MoaE [Moraxella macacae]|uniref:molybdenum cofactor biosynthesis protein MoaE n=1 Tax=Moraxella macacae TaxID=765840 RepID=UPI00058C2BA8|nr:molybdenum cofactor biosynthesis protein MoaE [Moraxella macacae]
MNKKPHQNSSSISLSEYEAYQTAIHHGFALLDKPIDDRQLKTALLNNNCGALATFEGWVRNHNNKRTVTHLTYYGYEKLALNQGKKIIQHAKEKFDIQHAIALHRIGDLNVGDMAVWIGVTAHHRYPAFDACRWLLDSIKSDIPVWKQEFYADSTKSLWLSNNG